MGFVDNNERTTAISAYAFIVLRRYLEKQITGGVIEVTNHVITSSLYICVW